MDSQRVRHYFVRMQIDHDPKEPSRAAVVLPGLIQIIVFGAGFALIGYCRTNYSHQVGEWIFSLFGG